MKNKGIYVKDVPEDIYRKFRSRAAGDGLLVRDAAIKLFASYGDGK